MAPWLFRHTQYAHTRFQTFACSHTQTWIQSFFRHTNKHQSTDPNTYIHIKAALCTLLTHTHTQARSGVIWQRQALRPTWLFYHSFPQKCFSSSFSLWKTEFMTRHLFCWLHRPSAALVNDFPAILVASQNTWWHKWHEKYAVQFVSGYYFVAWGSYSYVLITGIFCRAGCHLDCF